MPPAFCTASSAATILGERCRQIPTTVPRVTPSATSSRAIALAVAFKSPYDTAVPANLMAGAAGDCAA